MGDFPRCFYEFGPFRLDPSERRLWRGGESVALSPKVFETLVFLVERGGRLVGKEELLGALWPDSFVEEGNLTNNVSTLRKTLGEGVGGQRYIETVPKRGYRFVAEVRKIGSPVAELIIERRTHTRTVTESEELPEAATEAGAVMSRPALGDGGQAEKTSGLVVAARSEGRAHRRRGVLVAAAILIVAAAALGIYRLSSQRGREARQAATPFAGMNISRLTNSGKVTCAAISPDGKYVAHVTEDARGDSLWVRNVSSPAGVLIAGPELTQYISVTFAPDGDSVYYVALDRDKGTTMLYHVPVLGGPSGEAAYDVGPVAFSPDGLRMAYFRMYRDESRLLVADADGANERTLAVRTKPDLFRMELNAEWNAPAWSPDGKTIACSVKSGEGGSQFETVVGINAEDGAEGPLTSARWQHCGQPVWFADGGGLLLTASESANGPEQIWHVPLRGGAVTRVTHDLNDYHSLGLTKDSNRLLAVQKNSVSGIWVAPEADAGGARQVASQSGLVEDIAWTLDGRIVYRSKGGGDSEVWLMNADGSNPKQLTSGALGGHGLAASGDGRYIFFASDRAGQSNIWRADVDGRNLTRLTEGDGEFYPQSTPDGAWVIYQRGELEPTLWKVPAVGGASVQLTSTRAVQPAVSPDGGLIAYHYLDRDLNRWGIGVTPSGGGQQSKRFDFPPTVTQRFVRWAPDGRSVAFVNTLDGAADIWLQPLDGGGPKRLTDFKAEQIIAFDWSRDGHSLAFVRGVEMSDVVFVDATAAGPTTPATSAVGGS